jgi:4-amino-4-deoxy-L-arabinose transferase-like glycosyltransferase
VSGIAEYVLLAVASIFWPLLITIVVIVLRTSHPVRLLAAFLAGGLLATIAIGIALVFTLDNSNVVSRDRRELDPAVNITVGVLALVVAAVVLRLGPDARERYRGGKPRSNRTERFLENEKLAFLAGLLLNVVPGFFPFVALKDIAEGGYPAAANVALVGLFYVIMFALIEIPLAGYLVSPKRTVVTVGRMNSWFDRNAKRVGAVVLGTVGAYLVVRGLVEL